MIQNLVLNNADHNFSVISAQVQQQTDQPTVVASPGSDTAINASLRSQLEAGDFASSGQGINANYAA
jgi:hypothetical protein